jgi:hypothetical protein
VAYCRAGAEKIGSETWKKMRLIGRLETYEGHWEIIEV